jgi:hypothetical protein
MIILIHEFFSLEVGYIGLKKSRILCWLQKCKKYFSDKITTKQISKTRISEVPFFQSLLLTFLEAICH